MVLVLLAFVNMRHLLAAKCKKSNTVCFTLWLIASAAATAAATSAAPQVAAQVVAQPVPSGHALTQQAIRNVLFDRNVTGEYPDGRQWAERFNANMTSTYVEQGQPMAGRMHFEGHVLCFTYPDAEDFSGGCFEVWQRGSNCFDFYGQGVGVDASYLQKSRGQGWSARAWIVDRPSTCTSELIG